MEGPLQCIRMHCIPECSAWLLCMDLYSGHRSRVHGNFNVAGIHVSYLASLCMCMEVHSICFVACMSGFDCYISSPIICNVVVCQALLKVPALRSRIACPHLVESAQDYSVLYMRRQLQGIWLQQVRVKLRSQAACQPSMYEFVIRVLSCMKGAV